MERLFEVIHEDAELLVINKPAGLVCHPTKTDEYSSLISRARLYLGKNSRPHLINRLDRETSGVVLVAKTDTAARELRQLMESRVVRKEYLAIVHGHVSVEHSLIDAPLGKDENSRVAVKNCVRPDGASSQTEFWVEKRFERENVEIFAGNHKSTTAGTSTSRRQFTLLRIQPLTGRKHQIRIHLAHSGHPIVGDKIYGGDEDLYLALVENRLTDEQRTRLIFEHHALHAGVLSFVWRDNELEFRCEAESWFKEFIK
ncbi:MAG TPA: RluA family pseudouridine synthase [Verrucomicrobiae bacterium]